MRCFGRWSKACWAAGSRRRAAAGLESDGVRQREDGEQAAETSVEEGMSALAESVKAEVGRLAKQALAPDPVTGRSDGVHLGPFLDLVTTLVTVKPPPPAAFLPVEPGMRPGDADRGVAGEPLDVAAEAVLSVARYRFGRVLLCAALP